MPIEICYYVHISSPEWLKKKKRTQTQWFWICIILGCPKSLYGFFYKIKDTFFIFTNNFIDLNILSMSAISHVV